MRSSAVLRIVCSGPSSHLGVRQCMARVAIPLAPSVRMYGQSGPCKHRTGESTKREKANVQYMVMKAKYPTVLRHYLDSCIPQPRKILGHAGRVGAVEQRTTQMFLLKRFQSGRASVLVRNAEVRSSRCTDSYAERLLYEISGRAVSSWPEHRRYENGLPARG